MSDHAWTQEHLAAYVAGGLSADENERLEAHVADCTDCTDALAAAQQFDRGLVSLFAPVRPRPGLEDRAVHTFRAAPRWQPTLKFAGWPRKLMAAAAVLLMLGTFGGLAGAIMSGGRLPMPGEGGWSLSRALRESELAATAAQDARQAEASARETAFRDRSRAGEPGNEDRGMESALSAGLPNAFRTDAEFTPPPATVAPSPGMPLGGGGGGGPAAGYSYNGPVPPGIPGIGGIGGIGGGGIGGFAGGIGGSPAPGGMGMPPAANPYFQGQQPPGNGKFALYTGMSPDGKPALGFFRPGETRPPPTDSFNPTSAQDPGKMPPPPGTAPAPTPAGPSGPATGFGGAQPPKPDPKDPAGPAVNPEPARRIVIRSGDMEFVVESFDTASEVVAKLVTDIKGAFVATINSEKLPNGKVKGAITVRTPPEALDGLVLNLRRDLGKMGELKGVKISSADITKQYTDLESRLKAARTMETRLLAIIKEGKGEIKQLLEAERELGVWRTKIEELEGELRYYSNLAALSTLTITLAEKEIRAAAEITENERVQAGVEVEDVDKAYQQLLAAVMEAKGRITKSEVKQLSAGQFNATMNFEVPPAAAGPMRDRLRQLGRVARLDIGMEQRATGTLPSDAKTRRGDTAFQVQLYNLANVQPREVAMLQVAVPDVPAAYQALRDAVAKANGRVFVAQLNEQDRQNVTAQLDFEVRRTEEAAVRAAIDAAGEVVGRQVHREPESDNVTDAKVLYRTTLLAANRLRPRETATLSVEVNEVEQTAAAFTTYVAEAKGRQVDGRSDRDRSGKVTTRAVYEVPLVAAAGLVEQFKKAGTVRLSQSARDPQAPDGRYATARIDVTLTSAEPIVAGDAGLWPPVKKGLTYSASVLLTSVTWVVFGLCVVLPWMVVGFGGYRVVRWMTRPTAAPATVPVTTTMTPPPAS